MIPSNLTAKHQSNLIHAILNYMSEGLYVVDANASLLITNAAAEKILGWSSAEIIGNNMHEIAHSRYPDGSPFPLEACLGLHAICRTEAIQGFEDFFIRKDGSFLPVRYTAVPIIDGNCIDGAIVLFQEITPEKPAQRQLFPQEKLPYKKICDSHVSEELFQTMADCLPIIVWLMDETGKVVYYNRQGLEFFGFQANQPYDNFHHMVHPEAKEAVQKKFEAAVQSRAHYRDEFEIRRADGKHCYLLASGGPRFSKNGDFIGYVGSAIDITDRKNAEQALRLYSQRLEKSNQELETFATVASHDLQTPLRKVIMFSDRLKAMAQDSLPSEALDNIERMQKASLKMKRLIDDLLALSRISRKTHPFEKIRLADILNEVKQEMDNLLASAQGETHIAPAIETIELTADPSQLYLLFQNLMENSLKFKRKEVPPVIEVDAHVLSEHKVEIIYRDNGIGFEEKNAERIFMAFERLHSESEYPGSGIGLAICHKIAERHGGFISASGKPGEGATFIVSLPLYPHNKY